MHAGTYIKGVSGISLLPQDRTTTLDASDELEALSGHIKTVVVGLRDGTMGYRDVYAVRHAIGKITGRLGVGVPQNNYVIDLDGLMTGRTDHTGE